WSRGVLGHRTRPSVTAPFVLDERPAVLDRRGTDTRATIQTPHRPIQLPHVTLHAQPCGIHRGHILRAPLRGSQNTTFAGSLDRITHLDPHRLNRLPTSKQPLHLLDKVSDFLIRQTIKIHYFASHSMPSRLIQYVSRATHAYIDPVLDTSTAACCADEPPHATMKRCVSAGASFAAMSPDQIWYPDLLDARKGVPDASATRPRNHRAFTRRPIARLHP